MTTTIPQPYSVDFARPLGGLEHFLSLIDQHRPTHFAMTAQIEGPRSIPAWRAALDKLQERHPLLSVGIETDEMVSCKDEHGFEGSVHRDAPQARHDSISHGCRC